MEIIENGIKMVMENGKIFLDTFYQKFRNLQIIAEFTKRMKIKIIISSQFEVLSGSKLLH